MPPKPRILAFAGSTRAESFNKKLVRIAAAGAKAAGADVTVLDLRDYPLALYDADSEARDGLPANALKLKQLVLAHDGLLIASPEYNSSISPLLKNTMDWVSRVASPEEPGLAAYRGKVAGLVSASPGALGGLRGLVHVRAILGNINVLVIPEQVAVPNAPSAFDADGRLTNEKQQAQVMNVGRRLAEVIAKLKA
jgi:NAD(P)H-dependent FMN reductase